MALKRARGAHDRPVIMLVSLAAVGWMCALVVCSMDRMRRDVCRTIGGIEDRLLTQVDELCVAAHTIGWASAGAVPPPPDLAAEADDAERVADEEERGERAPQKGQRARRTAAQDRR